MASGRGEWLEFWKENHLLSDFADAYSRRECGDYGGRTCDFLSLPDLIRSKETEREKDWLDIQYLEEIQDARLAAEARAGRLSMPSALAGLRSRRGLETQLREGNLSDTAAVAEGMRLAKNPITTAILLPCASHVVLPDGRIEAAIEGRLRVTAPGSPLHLTLVEAVRRRYKQDAMEVDKADKRAVRDRLATKKQAE